MANPTQLAYVVASEILMWLGQHDKAIDQTKRAIALAPNDAYAQLKLAELLVYAGQPREALEYIADAARLDPLGEPRQLYIRGLAEFGLEQFDKAAASLQRTLKLNPIFTKPTAVLTACYGFLGQQDAAKHLLPYWNGRLVSSIASTVLQFPYQHEDDRKRLAEGLRKAGLKEF
jgi:tetratricopeptide (TPR) repeat protein